MLTVLHPGGGCTAEVPMTLRLPALVPLMQPSARPISLAVRAPARPFPVVVMPLRAARDEDPRMTPPEKQS